jgi:hypothetical protein
VYVTAGRSVLVLCSPAGRGPRQLPPWGFGQGAGWDAAIDGLTWLDAGDVVAGRSLLLLEHPVMSRANVASEPKKALFTVSPQSGIGPA